MEAAASSRESLVEPGGAAPGRPFVIRSASASDCAAIAELVRELAAYEKLEQFARATPADFRDHLFGAQPAAEALIAEVEGAPVGFAVMFRTFSTFRGRPGMYLEDVFVRQAYRGRGIGKALLAEVARRARDRGCGRLEWSVLNWNTPAIGFYRSLGARPLDEWTVFRLEEESFERLGSLADGPDSP
jgi:GNAT superfamily N-acetyltransferase